MLNTVDKKNFQGISLYSYWRADVESQLGVQFVKAVENGGFFFKSKKGNTIFHPNSDLYFNLFDLNSQTLL